ncbi:MAG: hypothetical protein KC983_10635, partial [Phycisphaerales bacterium]|nr:hypothetical protein [Phycisphaerales bacterium]
VDLPWHAIIPNWTIEYDLKRTDVGDDLHTDGLPAVLGRANSIVMPVTLRGHPLTAAQFTLIAPLPPYDLAGGIYRVEAHHPKREDRSMTIQLLGGRRGPAAARPVTRFLDPGTVEDSVDFHDHLDLDGAAEGQADRADGGPGVSS